MKGMIIQQYGKASDAFEYRENIQTPTIADNEVLIKNYAASVNPIDALKRSGYGAKIFSKNRKPEFPYILGCDAAGEIVALGKQVNGYQIGEQVCYISNSFKQGVYAEYGVADQASLIKKPHNLTFEQAATVPYVSLTIYRALVDCAGLIPRAGANKKKILVHAGSGGIGSLAIQLSKLWGCYVATTCSQKNKAWVKHLGADEVIDYQEEDFSNLLFDYDIVLDTLGSKVPGVEERSLSVLARKKSSAYVTLVHPFIKNFDEKGVVKGLLCNAWQLMHKKIKNKPVRYYWCLYKPNKNALKQVMHWFEEGSIKPVLKNVFCIKEVAKAHELIESCRSQGKIALSMECLYGKAE